jgi:hypothetical protein
MKLGAQVSRPVAEVEAKLAELRRVVDADRERAELGWRCP